MKLYFTALIVAFLATFAHVNIDEPTQQTYLTTCKRSVYITCPKGSNGPSAWYCPPKAKYSRNSAFWCAVRSGGSGGTSTTW